jgi:hypothetical protein
MNAYQLLKALNAIKNDGNLTKMMDNILKCEPADVKLYSTYGREEYEKLGFKVEEYHSGTFLTL